MRHELLGVELATLRHDDETRRIFVIGLIAQVIDHRQFLGAHLLGDLLEHPRA